MGLKKRPSPSWPGLRSRSKKLFTPIKSKKTSQEKDSALKYISLTLPAFTFLVSCTSLQDTRLANVSSSTRDILNSPRSGFQSCINEASKLKIGEYVSRARASGESLESIARNAHGMRRSIGEIYKNQTPELIRREIYGRNLYLYKDELGPSFDRIVSSKVKKDHDLNMVYGRLISSSQATNNPLNNLLSIISRELP